MIVRRMCVNASEQEISFKTAGSRTNRLARKALTTGSTFLSIDKLAVLITALSEKLQSAQPARGSF